VNALPVPTYCAAAGSEIDLRGQEHGKPRRWRQVRALLNPVPAAEEILDIRAEHRVLACDYVACR
jgi:hypothetical protein